MKNRVFIIRAVAAIAMIWLLVWGVRSWAGGKKITADKVQTMIAKADFSDWSSGQESDVSVAKLRDERLREIASTINKLDFYEREKNRENRTAENFFKKLNPSERSLFINLTVAETMNQFMVALDQMSPDERKKFVKRGLQQIEKGQTAADIERTKELGDDVMKQITQEGMRAYFEKASTDTKLDLAPLMESMNDVMQGMKGNPLMPH